jgi:CheY-like chemotaxis protein
LTVTVLVVDDSKLARMVFKKNLNAVRPGWAVVEAVDAPDAMSKYAEVQPSVAFLDFNMPGRNGLELAGDLRALTTELPIAIITANVQDEVQQRAAELDASFIPKPLSEAGLAEFLDTLTI